MYAVEVSNLAIVKLLLQRGANPNCPSADGATALHFVSSSGIAKMLLSHGASVNAGTMTPKGTCLHALLGMARDSPDQKKVLRALLSHGADVNALNSAGQTPIDVFCANTEELNKEQ